MPLTQEELRRRLADQSWTSHNIRLTSEITTMPGAADFMETDLRLKAIFRALAAFYRNHYTNCRAVDLGCLEGGFALSLAQRGMNVLGIEARRANIKKSQLLKDHFALDNLDFQLGDVKDFTRERFGVFDVTLALGILYHLDRPIEWLGQAADATRGLLIVDSHFAPADQTSLEQIDPRLTQLGPLKTVEAGGENYQGRWFFEYDERHDRENQLWASYSNSSSFWLTKESLLKALSRTGFDLVLEQHDYSVDSYQHLSITFPRGMFLAVKIGGLDRI